MLGNILAAIAVGVATNVATSKILGEPEGNPLVFS